MKLIDFFDFNEQSHLNALKTLLTTGKWDEAFYENAIENGIIFTSMDAVDLCFDYTRISLGIQK